jgi:hypothetical protein
MKQHILVAFLLVFGLNQAFGQLFLQNKTRNFVGFGLNTDPGKPFELRFARITPSGLGSLQLKLSPGYKRMEIYKTTNYHTTNIIGFGVLNEAKQLKFICIEPGVFFPIKKHDFRRSFVAFNLPMAFTQINTYQQFYSDPLYDNQLKIYRDPKLHYNLSAEMEFLWAFNVGNRSYVETGVSLTIPIHYQELFGESIGRFSETNYVPGAAFFPFINFSFSYHFALTP